MVEITKYGPVLDPTIEAVKELTRYGQAEIRSSLHPEAAGMAADMIKLLRELDPYTDVHVWFPDRFPLIIQGTGTDPDIHRYTVTLIRERNRKFEVSDLDKFLSCPYNTHIDLEDRTQTTIEKPIVSVTAIDTPPKFAQGKADDFIYDLINAGVELPEQRYAEQKQRVNVNFSYQSVASSLTIKTFYQHFIALEKFHRTHANREGYDFPVSELDQHNLDLESWEFFMEPAFWDSWSKTSSLVINKLIGNQSYEGAEQYYSIKDDSIRRHATEHTEAVIIRYIQAMKEGTSLNVVADSVDCPPRYRDIYFKTLGGTFNWLLRQGSLRDREKRQFLENLVEECEQHGLTITPEELAELRFKP